MIFLLRTFTLAAERQMGVSGAGGGEARGEARRQATACPRRHHVGMSW